MSKWGVLGAGLALVVCFGFGLAGAQDVPAGRLAIAGTDGNIIVRAADGVLRPLTSDAGVAGSTLRFYQWPTWSNTTGGLAFFGVELDRQGESALEAWVSADGQEQANPVYRAEGETYTYAYWTPQACPEGGLCDSIATLISGGADGFQLTLIPADGSEAQTVGQGAPFYFDWSPDGAAMAWHRGNTRLDLYDLAQTAVVGTVPEQTGQFTAPAFSPVGDGALLFAVLDPSTQTTSLVIQRGQPSFTLASGLDSVSFAWSPDGTQVAWREPSGPLIVSDAATGDELARTPMAGILAFFWSPDGDRLAYVTVDAPPEGSFSAKRASAPLQQGSPTRLLWSVLSVVDGSIQRAASFAPTRDQVYLLSYFDQFALSHRVWSPDGTRIAYGDLLTADQPVVQILDVNSPGSTPQTVAPGTIGIWSFD